jgi:hypothetical protein
MFKVEELNNNIKNKIQQYNNYDYNDDIYIYIINK